MTEPNASSPSSPAPAAPAAPKLDLSHEPEAVQRIMSHPDYWSNNPVVRQHAAEAAYAARQAALSPPLPSGDEKTAPGEDAKPRPQHDEMPPGQPTNDVASQVVFPDEVPAPVRQVWQSIATDVGIGSRELGEIAKAAVPFLNDETKYTYESGERALREQFGAKAPEILGAAKDYIREFPEVLRALEVRGLASHPGVIRVLAERWAAREEVHSRLKELRSDPQYFQQKGIADHEAHARLVGEVEALMSELHS